MQNYFNWLAKSPSISSLIKKHNWEQTSLGPVKDWPLSLKTAINMCLECRYPMYIWWGSDFVNIYNDAYIAIAGLKKHEKAFGRPAKEMWPENWHRIEVVIKKVYDQEESHSFKDHKTQIERYGKLEDACFDFSFNLLRDEQGRKRGIYSIAFEKEPKAFEIQDQNPFKIMSDFFTQAPTPMCILLGENHTYGLANPLYEKLVGKKVVGKTVAELFDHETITPFIKILDNVYQTRVSFSGKEMQLTFEDEAGVPTEYWLDILYHPFVNEEGKSKGILVVVVDVSEQVLVKEELRRAQEEIRRLSAQNT